MIFCFVHRQYEQLAAMKEKSRSMSQDGASQEHLRSLEAKLDQEKLARQRADTQVSTKNYIPFSSRLLTLSVLEIR